ncbi:MAG: SpoIIE family protein phosphatase, partial [bacterium]|nr:SpoIIE family protein phosphatase [bacterium]
MGKRLKKLFQFRLRTKIVGLVIFQIIMIMGTISYYNMNRDFDARELELDERMQQIAATIASMSPYEWEESWIYYQENIDNLYKAIEDIVYISIFDSDDVLVAYVINEDIVEYPEGIAVTDSLERDAVIRLMNSTIDAGSINDLGNVQEDIRVGEEYTGLVSMGYSKINLNNMLGELRARTFFMVIVFLVVGFVTSLFLANTVASPLKKLSNAMETLPQGKMDMLVETKDEIGSLARSYNQMVRELRGKEFFEQFEKDLGTVFTLEKIFVTLLGRLQSRFSITKGALYIKSNDEGSFSDIYQHGFKLQFNGEFHESLRNALEVHINKGEVSFSIEGLKIIANETPSIRPFVEELEQKGIFWVVFMIRQKKCIGVIYFGKEHGDDKVNIEEKKFIVNLVNHTYLPIENALLYADLTEQERYKKEIEIAQKVQEQLLPQRNPVIEGYDIYGTCISAKETGGDYFDYVPIDDNRIGIVIADVVGKGTSAAFYMAEIKGMIVSLSTIYKSPKEILKVMNSRLFMNVDRKVFATMIYGILNKKTNEFVYSRAG